MAIKGFNLTDSQLKDVYSPDLVNIMKGNCVCGEPIPLPFEAFMSKDKDIMICKKCGRDNSSGECYD